LLAGSGNGDLVSFYKAVIGRAGESFRKA